MFIEIMKFMKKYKKATASQISKVLGTEVESVETALMELQHMGSIKKEIQSGKHSCSGCGMCSCSDKKQAEVFIYPANINEQKQEAVKNS